VKPANVLLGDGGRPRLADFGISRTLDATTATANGCVVGTAA
jgi:serine/threonine protein kinase